MTSLSKNCYSFLVDYAEEMNLHQALVYSLAIIVWVNNFEPPKIQAVLSSFFHDGNDFAHGGGWGWRVVSI